MRYLEFMTDPKGNLVFSIDEVLMAFRYQEYKNIASCSQGGSHGSQGFPLIRFPELSGSCLDLTGPFSLSFLLT